MVSAITASHRNRLPALHRNRRHRLLILQTANHRHGTPTDHDAYIQAAVYPNAITLAAAELTPRPAGPE
jgi:hypothetical protein